jgi:acetyltransferase-like isoleucine patch superfamily enzyme
MKTGRTIPGDWFKGVIPANVKAGAGVHIDSAYNLAGFHSKRDPGLTLEIGASIFGSAQLFVGVSGVVRFGPYSSTTGTLICSESIEIGAHCMMAWSSVITDCWPDADAPMNDRRAAVIASSADPERFPPVAAAPRRVILEDSVWIGFGAVVLPGVRIGRGSIVGSRTVLSEDVPPYTVVAGNPARFVRTLAPSDTAEARRAMMARITNGPG